MIETGLGAALARVVDALERLEIRYALVGGLAVSAWAVPRATGDADIWADLGRAHKPLQNALEDAGFHVPAMDEELQRFGVFRSKCIDQGVFVDIFDATGPLGEYILSHRVEGHLATQRLWLASPSALAVLKAYSDRSRDYDDLVALLSAAEVDVPELRDWARKLDHSIGTSEISERVASAMAEAQRARSGR